MLFDWNRLCTHTHPHKQKQNSQQLFLSSHPTLLYPPLSPISERRKPLCVCVCSHLQVPDELSHGDLLCHPMVEAMAVQNHALEDGQGALQDGHVHHRLVDVARNLSEHRENPLTQRTNFVSLFHFLVYLVHLDKNLVEYFYPVQRQQNQEFCKILPSGCQGLDEVFQRKLFT